MFKSNEGFTLIEMLIVLLIISVLIILIVPNLSKRSGNVHEKGCSALIKVVQAQVDLYIFEEGSKPNELDDLVSENYLTEDQLICGNGKELVYENETVKAITSND